MSPLGCGCALQSSQLTITGSGAPGDPWDISGVGVARETNADRLLRSGGDLYDGLVVWTTDTDQMWAYSGTVWINVYGKFGAIASASGVTATATALTPAIPLTETYDPFGFHTSTAAELVVPTGQAGLYLVQCTVIASDASFAVNSHIVMAVAGNTHRGGALGVASTILPQFTMMREFAVADEVSAGIYNAGGTDRTCAVTLRMMKFGTN